MPSVSRGTDQIISRIPLDPKPDSRQFTPKFAVRRYGPVDLKAGDRVLVSAREQLDNNNTRADGAWREWVLRTASLIPFRTLKGLRYKLETSGADVLIDPRWTLWVGANLGVCRTTSRLATTGAQVIRETGENWDNWVHHWRWADQGWDIVNQDAPGSYYVTTVWLDTNPDYRLANQAIDVTPRGSLEVAIF